MTEVVRFAGGWLFDRVMAGWDVTVLTADRADARPLRILGARAAWLEPVLASPVRGPRPKAIAVHADLYDCDERVRLMVLDALDEGRVEVSVWGDRWAVGADDWTGSVRHRLSLAARAFKAQAMAAAAMPADGEEPVEVFRSAGPIRSSRRT